MNQPKKHLDIPVLAELLKEAKLQETAARLSRLHIEEQILEHPDVAEAIKEEGTTRVGRLKITTGYTRKWAQEELPQLLSGIPKERQPFKVDYKEARADSKAMERMHADEWGRIKTALTLTPKKASIEVVEDS